jgi:hypothetical protein
MARHSPTNKVDTSSQREGSQAATIDSARQLLNAQLQAVRLLPVGRVEVVLVAVFLLSAIFYVWTADTSVPLSLHDGSQDRYNLLATALLHLSLSISKAPAALAHLTDPYNPKLNGRAIEGATDASSLNDDALYKGQLYFIWGAAPALVLLVPLHLLGFEPSASVTVSVYSVVGLGFALAALRVLLKRLGELPIWMCAVAAFTVSMCSAIPFLLRTPSVSEDILAGGYCFSMAGVYLVMSALARRSASVLQLALMSLCFGLAAGSRPALGFEALVLIPVYLWLRPSRSRRSLAISLGLPVAVCFVLLLAYNQARFREPFEIGTHYQLTGYDSRDAPIGRLSYTLPGSLLYVTTPPEPMIVFPFIALRPPRVAFPNGLGEPEITGGLLPMVPIVVFGAALPWIWRRRPALLGPFAVPLMVLAGTGLMMVLVVSYEFFASTERYEVDFATLFVLGGLASWLALSKGPPGWPRRLLRVGGGVLAVWGCIAGFATSFFGYGNALVTNHPGIWSTLEDAGAPLSTALDAAIGHPVVAASFTSVSTGSTQFLLRQGEEGVVTIVSAGTDRATLAAAVEPRPGTHFGLGVEGLEAGYKTHPLSGGAQTVEIPVRLHIGLNHLAFFPVADLPGESPAALPVIHIKVVSVASAP